MPRARANGIEIEYDHFGDRRAEPLLLITGLGAQMILWDEEFCEELAGRGHWVVRFDNRDVGLSTKIEARGAPDLLQALTSTASGGAIEAAYTLDDMADDAAGLLDALEVARAHVVGASLGGMIAQTLTTRHPARVKSLVSIMSTTGNPDLPRPTSQATGLLMRERAADREGALAQALEGQRLLSGHAFPIDEARLRARAARAYDRCFYPEGIARQMLAIMASGNRRAALERVRAPTLVIHGDADPLVPIEGGRDTAAAIPGSELLVIEGMGHELPPGAWPRVISAISAHIEKASRA